MSTTQPTALITGVHGQDGSYLAERLVGEGWNVHGVFRPGSSSPARARDHDDVTLHAVDLVDEQATTRLFDEVRPNHVFHFAGMSSVGRSWHDPMTTVRVNAVATTSLLNLAHLEQERSGDPVVFVNASSSEIFGAARDGARSENDPVAPTSPYGATKAYAHQLGAVYRSHGLAVSNAILFNHESPRRGVQFVTGKIAQGAALIARGEMDHLSLGDMSARRDWGWAPDYVDAMFRMALTGTGDDYVIATGRSHSVRDFVAAAFAAAGIEDWERHVVTDEAHMRPVDPADCVGDARRARETLGWTPTVEFPEIVRAMVESHMSSRIDDAMNKERV
ncbi:GDP-mannose 4,6-dehydratase [Williamsia maris]|uniref:GDP-mannose 4,6-dehydratase n=1 Tax=Williamsia maris TaxID=72806 RepID=A0ABT1HGU4_9NOCA|nr:GDP-mannose 4,6-dehydratase [Williamsia maris]MCP2177092.1 GDPmannose 4,6-dehydratase [Williamsia maris]